MARWRTVRIALLSLLPALAAGLLAAVWVPAAHAAPGDTTWVHTYVRDFYNWATPHDSTFQFPDTSVRWEKILARYTIGCPPSPDDCDPWDRIGWLQVLHDTGERDSLGQPVIEPYEILRVITPYDITGSIKPDSCTWVFDVTDYVTLLHDSVTLRNYIESWIGGSNGWLVTIDFAFIEGEPAVEPFLVRNLWTNHYTVYGDPSRPIEAFLAPISVAVDARTVGAKLRIVTTGHGQGNTGNCAEFCRQLHWVKANADSFGHYLWRDDCARNTCSPQGGTWRYNRAGWCPGDGVWPWDIDVSAEATPGGTLVLDYDIQPYENLCRPNNPNCVSGVTCASCDYNGNTHTEPIYAIWSQLILYRAPGVSGVGEAGPRAGGPEFALEQNAPNPFGPETEIRYTIPAGQRVTLVIFDAAGRVVRRVERAHETAGSYLARWDGRDETGRAVAPGVYFCQLRGLGATEVRKMVVAR